MKNDTKRIGDIHYSLTSTGAIVQTKFQAEQECHEVHNGRLPIIRDARNMDQMCRSKEKQYHKNAPFQFIYGA